MKFKLSAFLGCLLVCHSIPLSAQQIRGDYVNAQR